MKKVLSTAAVFALSGALFLSPLGGDLRAADIFTKITTGPGGGIANSRGGAWGDYDGDRFIDLFIPQANSEGDLLPQRLYHNNGDGSFTRVTAGPIAAVKTVGYGAAWGDYDNDGNLDLVLITDGLPNYLFHNNGSGSFSEVPDAEIVSTIGAFRSVCWVDYNRDGYLDLFSTAIGLAPRQLYENLHDGTFRHITGGDFLDVPGTFLSTVWGDYNNDGWPDLFLPNNGEEDLVSNYLYRNDAEGVFTRVGEGILNGNSNGAAADWGDYDNDGDLDLFVSCRFHPPNVASRPNLLYRNDGNDKFTPVTSVPANDPQYQGGASYGCKWGDYDNDGWLDLFVANGLGQNDFLYHNNRDETFTRVLDSIAVKDGGDSRSAAWGDYDNDGFLDLFVGSVGSPNLLYHNNGNTNHWMEFRLIGTRSNRSAIGAKVRVRANIDGKSFWQMREVSGGDGLSGQNSLYVHFGLGDATNSDLVRIEWPSGTVQELNNVAAGRVLTVTEPGGEPRLEAARENGQMQLTLTGKQGSRYLIETSTALPAWLRAVLAVTITNQSGTIAFPAPDGAGGGQRFYRAVWE